MDYKQKLLSLIVLYALHFTANNFAQVLCSAYGTYRNIQIKVEQPEFEENGMG